MDRIRDWMHGKGRGVVIVVMVLLALWIIVDFYRTSHEQPEPSDKPVQQMAPVKDTSSEDTPDEDTQEDTDPTAKPDDADSTSGQKDGQTESEENVGRTTQDQDASDTETTQEDTKDSGMTTIEEDVGAGSEACRTE
ncbi:hypothetical protein [Jutongia sp.]